MRYKKRKKAASQVMAMAVLVVAVLAVLFVLASSQVFKVRSILVVGNRDDQHSHRHNLRRRLFALFVSHAFPPDF